MTRKKWIVVLFLITCGIMTFSFIRFWNGHADVAAGNIAYTYNCSWVDWKHARPGKVTDFINDFSTKFDQTPLNGTFKITYGQNGGFKQMGYSIFSYNIAREYKILKLKEDEKTKKKLMFQIFKDVSFLFENYQKEVFWGILQSSAFREGDLMGNLISFYIACEEVSQEEASVLCGELSIPISLQLKKEGKFQMNESFIPKYRIITNENLPIFPMLFIEYNELENAENYISPLKKIRNATILNTISI